MWTRLNKLSKPRWVEQINNRRQTEKNRTICRNRGVFKRRLPVVFLSLNTLNNTFWKKPKR